jgi:hypothetical protein
MMRTVDQRDDEKEPGFVVALAGRRVDAEAAVATRFPLANTARVRRELKALFLGLPARALVCSAACGADLLALDVASEIGLRSRVVLPFSAERFRETSVVDRPGAWAGLFDAAIAGAKAEGDLVVLGARPDDDESYAAANARLVEEAVHLADSYPVGSARCAAVVVWDGAPRPGPSDLTAEFAALARAQSWPVYEIETG